MSYKIQMTRDAVKDFEKIKKSQYSGKLKQLLQIIEKDPYQTPPPFESLKGSWCGLYSRRINRQHRLVYEVRENMIVIKSMWTHYENV